MASDTDWWLIDGGRLQHKTTRLVLKLKLGVKLVVKPIVKADWWLIDGAAGCNKRQDCMVNGAAGGTGLLYLLPYLSAAALESYTTICLSAKYLVCVYLVCVCVCVCSYRHSDRHIEGPLLFIN